MLCSDEKVIHSKASQQKSKIIGAFTERVNESHLLSCMRDNVKRLMEYELTVFFFKHSNLKFFSFYQKCNETYIQFDKWNVNNIRFGIETVLMVLRILKILTKPC